MFHTAMVKYDLLPLMDDISGEITQSSEKMSHMIMELSISENKEGLFLLGMYF